MSKVIHFNTTPDPEKMPEESTAIELGLRHRIWFISDDFLDYSSGHVGPEVFLMLLDSQDWLHIYQMGTGITAHLFFHIGAYYYSHGNMEEYDILTKAGFYRDEEFNGQF